MRSAPFFEALLSGPSPAIVGCLLVIAIGAAIAVFWTMFRLVVDPRARIADDPEDRVPERDDTAGAGYETGYPMTKGDGTG